MKKIFAFVAAAACALSAFATDYQGELTVTVNDVANVMGSNITIEKNDSLYDLSIKNFKLIADGESLPVGNIELKGCKGKDAFGITTIEYNKNVTITAGDDPAYSSSDWLGPMLGEVPIDMTAKLNDNVLCVSIDIDMKALQQVIEVDFVGSVPAGLKGDLNADGVVNVGDVTTLVNQMLQ